MPGKLEASYEACEFLKSRGLQIYPVNDDKYFEKGIRGGVMSLLYFVMAKTKIGIWLRVSTAEIPCRRWNSWICTMRNQGSEMYQ